MPRRYRLIVRAIERIMHHSFCIVHLDGHTFAKWLTADELKRICQSGGSVEKF